MKKDIYGRKLRRDKKISLKEIDFVIFEND